MRLAEKAREYGFLKYYRLVRKWACDTYGLTTAEIELLIFLYHQNRFTRKEFQDGEYIMSWDKKRWDKLRKDGWIETFRHRNRTTIKYSIFKTSFQCDHLIARMYRICAGEEDLPTSDRSVYYKNKSYTDKVMNKSIDDMIKDKDR